MYTYYMCTSILERYDCNTVMEVYVCFFLNYKNVTCYIEHVTCVHVVMYFFKKNIYILTYYYYNIIYILYSIIWYDIYA